MGGVTVIRECTTTSYMGYIMMIIAIIITFVMSCGLMKIGEGLFNKTGNDFYDKAGAVLALSIFLSGTIMSIECVPKIDEFQKPTFRRKLHTNLQQKSTVRFIKLYQLNNEKYGGNKK